MTVNLPEGKQYMSNEHEVTIEQMFFEKMNRGKQISDPQDLPAPCRNLLEKTILMNFYAEWWGGINYFRSLDLAPSITEMQYMEIIAREEMGHAHILAKGSLSVLGIDPHKLLAKTVKEQTGILRVFQHPEMITRSWGDVLMFNRLQDSSADMQLDEFADGCFQPYCDDIGLIEAEEVGHVEHGNESIRHYIQTEKGRFELNRALHDWLPLVLDVFGKPGGKSEGLYLTYKLKHRTNEESRQLFIASIAPFFQEVGLTHPLLGTKMPN